MNDTERQQIYKQHRLRVRKATSLVNSQAPKPKPTNEEMKNLSFLEMMNELIRATSDKREKFERPSLGGDEDKKYLKMDFEKSTNHKSKDFAIPFHIRQRYDHLLFIRDWNLMQKLLRPNIFLDLVSNGQQPLGRLVVQLFTEACPEVVLQFVRTCLAKQHGRFNITRLLIPLWLEAELLFDDRNALTSKNIAHDPMAINHGSYSGVLSFPSRYLHGSKLRFITFTMSFTPIDVLNGKRIAFGIITSGQKLLERIQNFEVTRSGKPCKNIVVSACGVC